MRLNCCVKSFTSVGELGSISSPIREVLGMDFRPSIMNSTVIEEWAIFRYCAAITFVRIFS